LVANQYAITEPRDGAPVGNGSMLALPVATRAKVDAFYTKALELGAADEGAPGVRGESVPPFYGAYFRDLDGNKLCIFNIGPG
jgi:predicted lactoylglutathione lyase